MDTLLLQGQNANAAQAKRKLANRSATFTCPRKQAATRGRRRVKAFEKASGKDVPYEIVERRAGDIAISFADSTYAKEKLNWESELDLEKMCEDTRRWQLKNPNGYR